MLNILLLSFFINHNIEPVKYETTVCLNEEEAKLYEMINDYRASKKLKPILFSAKLTAVAQMHAKDLMDNYDIESSKKCNPHSWSKKGEWSSCCYTSDHKKAQCMWDKPKEIAGYNSPGYEIAYYSSAGATAEEGLKGWKKSPSHNPLLINTGIWKDIDWGGLGIGIYGEYGVVWFGQLEDEQRSITVCN